MCKASRTYSLIFFKPSRGKTPPENCPKRSESIDEVWRSKKCGKGPERKFFNIFSARQGAFQLNFGTEEFLITPIRGLTRQNFITWLVIMLLETAMNACNITFIFQNFRPRGEIEKGLI
jgi:hypothetical protein